MSNHLIHARALHSRRVHVFTVEGETQQQALVSFMQRHPKLIAWTVPIDRPNQ